MKTRHLSIIILIFLCASCKSKFEKSLISDAAKLKSPNGEAALYRYHVDSPMAFGSGFTVINIYNSDEAVDLTDTDILRFGHAYPFWIKWKDKNTIAVKCFTTDSGTTNQQPYKTEIIKWKEWKFDVAYYSLYSGGATQKFLFEKFSIEHEKIKFKSKTDSLVFFKDEVQFSLDSNHIYVTKFKVSTYKMKLGLSFSNYDLVSERNFQHNYLTQEQPFVLIKP